MVKKVIKYLVAAGIAMCIFIGIYSFTVIANTPKIDPDHIYDYLSESSLLLDDKGKVIESIYLDNGNRTNIKYKDIPKNLVNAVVAIEDKTFWKHHGFNVWRIFGAIKDSIFSGGDVSGTSTITQQLARNVYLSETKSVHSLSRKISEAYYTVILEQNLSKEQIMEAYLNSIYLGNNSYGVEAAARSYFNKDAKKMNLIECAALAALPKAPDSYALVKKRDLSEGKAGLTKNQKILNEDSNFITYYNGDASKPRRDLTLKFMEDQGYITAKQEKDALKKNLLKELDISASGATSGTSYFVDYLIEDLAKEFMDKYNYSEAEAKAKIYSGGLKIHTTLNKKAQKAVENAFNNNYNFPDNTNINYDGNGNILNENGNITLYKYSNYFNDKDQFVLKSSEYKTSGGNLTLLKNKRLNFYKTTVNGQTDYSIEFNNLYKYENGTLYSIQGGSILVPAKYKSLDSKGNLVISKDFWKDKEIKTATPGFFKKSGNTYVVPKTCYALRAKVRQPQAAMVITDYKTGGIKAMVGGRGVSGKKLYNRAINPRQPGSSIKPLAVYSSALQQGADAAESGSPMSFTEFDDRQNTKYYGDFWTASSGINDAPIKNNGKDWPKNWYSGYKGEMTMRKAVEQSVNTIAVRVFQQVGDEYAIDQLKKMGITSLVTDGSVNDRNPAALALGGMTKGISPLEMSSAFGTFPNEGVHVDTRAYTEVEDKKGKVILESKKEETKVLDKGVAFIMQDILRTTVTNGLGVLAQVPGQTTAGKTGTTSDSMDIWFCGFTPQYSAALWIGNDVNITINATSDQTARLWSKIMSEATSGMNGSLPSWPSNVIRISGNGYSEYYVKGTDKGRRFNSTMNASDKKKAEEKKKKEEAEKKKKEEEAKKKKEETPGSTDPKENPAATDPATDPNNNTTQTTKPNQSTTQKQSATKKKQ